MKRFLSVLLAALLMASGGITAITFYNGGTEIAWAEDLHNTQGYKFENRGVYGYFTNYVDGYALSIDKSMKVDMSNSAVCAVLENREKRIEIYKQYVGNGGAGAYINYSNKFLSDYSSHILEYQGEQTIGENKAHLTVWHRNKLSRIANDKNYYMTIEIKEGSFVYTIMIKAAYPISALGGYIYLVKDFTTFTPTKSGNVKTGKIVGIENKNPETLEFYNKYFAPNSKLSWGIFNPHTAKADFSKVNEYERVLNYKFKTLVQYTDFQNRYGHPTLQRDLAESYRNGKVLELTLQTVFKPQGNMVYDVLNGQYDTYLTNYARTVASFGHPVIFRLGNEMNGDWCPYSSYHTSKDTRIFVEFYRYVYNIFKMNNANNVLWVWNPNGTSFPNYKWNNEIMYYPGDEYVDLIGMTAYNTGTYYHKTGERWQEFDTLYRPIYNRYCAYFNQPLMITEFSSSSTGGDKNQWVQNMFSVLPNYPRIKMAIWWDGRDLDPSNGNVARAYYIDDIPAVMETFKRNINR